MNLEDVVISVAQKEGWAVTIERKAETDIFFEFENLRQKERILFSLSTPVTIASGCLLIISLNIIRTTTQIMKHIYGLGLTGTEKWRAIPYCGYCGGHGSCRGNGVSTLRCSPQCLRRISNEKHLPSH